MLAYRGFLSHTFLFSNVFREKVLKIVKSHDYSTSLKKEGRYSNLILVRWLYEQMQINCSECPQDHQYAKSAVELFVGMAIQPSAKAK